MIASRNTRNRIYNGTSRDALSDLLRIKRAVEPLVSRQKAHRFAMAHGVAFARMVMGSRDHREAFDRLKRDIPARRDAGRWVVLVKYLGISETKATVARLAKEIDCLARRKEGDRELRQLIVEKGVKALIAETEQDVRPRSSELVRDRRRVLSANRSVSEARWQQTRPRQRW